MHYRSPAEVVELLKDEPDEWVTPPTFMFIHRARVKTALRHVSDLQGEWLPISRESAEEISKYLKENLKLEVPGRLVLQWFSLYPFESSAYDEIDHLIEESLESILDMVSHYYLNSWWPGVGDNIQDDVWIKLLGKAEKYFNTGSGNNLSNF